MALWDRLEQLFERDPNRSGSRFGSWVIALVLVSIVGWTAYSAIFMPPYEKQATVKPIVYTTSTAPELPVPVATPPPPPPPIKQQPESLPPAVKPQPVQPRPVAKPKGETEEQKFARKARLLSHYSGPFGEAWRIQAGNGNGNAQESQSKPGQVMELPAANSSNGNIASPNGAGNVWTKDFYNRGNGQPGVLQPPQSPYMIMRGSVIPVAFLGDFDTQTPGQICARVVQDIKDTRTGRYTMIPYGSTVCGGYDINLPYDQNRVPTAWDVLILPNTETMDLASFPGADRGGAAGTPVEVNTHFWRTAGRSLLLTITGAAAMTARSNAYSNGGDLDATDALAAQSGREIERRGRQMWDRGGYRGPTGTAKAGEVFLLQVTSNLEFPGDYYERNGGTGYAATE